MSDRLAALEEFLSRDPDDSFTRYAIGLEYLSRGDVPKAISLFMETIERDTSYLPAYQQLGQSLHRAGRSAEAMEWYAKGIALARARKEHHAAQEMSEELEDIRDNIS